MNPVDSMLAGGTASITAAVAPAVSPDHLSPVITQIIVPLIAAVLVPYLKDLASIHIKAIKDRLARRKRGKNDDHLPPAASMAVV